MEINSRFSRLIKNSIFVIAFPLVTYLIMEFLVYTLQGTHLLASSLDIRNLIRSMGMSTVIAYALSLNLASGRFDLSLGAQRLVATIIGGNIAINFGFNGVGILIMAVFFGLIFGGIVGLVFITFRVPPVVLGLGMALIYESLSFAGSGGQGLRLFGLDNIEMLVDPVFTISILAITTIAIFVLYTYTKFRYEMNAVRGSQKIAIDSGINVFKHVFVCYALAGGLVAISGVFNTAFVGGMTPVLGMTSNGAVIIMTFPMFIGTYLAQRSNIAVGILAGTLSVKFFGLGLTALKLTVALTNTINMIVFIGFLVFLANKEIPKRKRAQQKRIEMAKEKKRQLQLS